MKEKDEVLYLMKAVFALLERVEELEKLDKTRDLIAAGASEILLEHGKEIEDLKEKAELTQQYLEERHKAQL